LLDGSVSLKYYERQDDGIYTVKKRQIFKAVGAKSLTREIFLVHKWLSIFAFIAICHFAFLVTCQENLAGVTWQ